MQVRAGSNEEANRHTMLRPRHWWEATFRKHGAVVDKEMVWALQEKDAHFSDKEVGLGTLFAYGTVFWEWGLVLFEGGASYCYGLPLVCSNNQMLVGWFGGGARTAIFNAFRTAHKNLA